MPEDNKILIYVVDDDASVRAALEMLFLSAEMDVQTFERAEDLLECQLREENACLIIDIIMQGLGGIGLQKQLAQRGIKIPAIFLTAIESKDSRQQAKKAGAAGYLQKPVDDQALLDTIKWALSSVLSSKI